MLYRFCSGKDYTTRPDTYKGARLEYVPFFHANGVQSTPYDILSMLKCLRGYDTVVILGVSGCVFLPIFRLLYRKKLIVNIDGLEHKRAKWGKFSKWFLRISEAMAVRFADVIVVDNKGIQDYVIETYEKIRTDSLRRRPYAKGCVRRTATRDSKQIWSQTE